MPSRDDDHRPPPPPEPEQPTAATLLAQAAALTSLTRANWIAVILGCLYVWVTIAALRDIQLFLPSETLTLPIVNIGIAPDGFFFFAPLILLAMFIYLHLTLARLWRCYAHLQKLADSNGGTLDGLSVADRVAPWMLNHLIRHPERSFDWLRPGFPI